MDKLTFDCGCSVDATGVDFDNINYGCQKTWDLIATGKTQGIFQVESGLGKQLSKRLRPDSIEEMSALTALMRPGCLHSMLNGKTLTNHYIDRKHGQEPVEYLHPSLEPILESSQGILTYQEQVIKISQEIAGFNLKEGDDLRKGIGKKLAKILAELKEKFIDGCVKTNIVSEDNAKQIFEWIYNSSRYSFNKCFSGDTILKKQGCNLTIKEHYNIRNNIQYAKDTNHLSLYKKWKLYNNYSKGYSLQSDGRIRENVIKNISPAGIRQIYKITLKNGSYIRVTSNHKFPTTNGEKQTSQLTIGDELYVCGKYEKNIKKYGYSNVTKVELQGKKYQGMGFPTSDKNPGYTNGSYTKFGEFRKKNNKFCKKCGKTGRIEIHHINGDRSNSEDDNLINLCVSCHKKQEYSNGRIRKGQKGYPALTEKIISIQEDGIEEVFDVEMEAPYHNLVTSEEIVACNSHAISYGIIGYWTAWIKAHFPLEFYTVWLQLAKEKPKPKIEIALLVNDAKAFNINVLPPNIFSLEKDFHVDGESVRFGILNIKKIGDKQADKIIDIFKELKRETNWYNILIYYLPKINSASAEALISCGVFDFTKVSRRRMLYEFNVVKQISDTQIKHLQESNTTKLVDGLTYCLNVSKNKTSKAKLDSLINALVDPAYSLEDNFAYLADLERDFYGISLTCNRSSGYNYGDTFCIDILNGKTGTVILVAEITNLSEYTINKGKMAGKKMCYVTIQDDTAELESCILFPDAYEKYKTVIYPGVVILCKGKKQLDNNLIIETINPL